MKRILIVTALIFGCYSYGQAPAMAVNTNLNTSRRMVIQHPVSDSLTTGNVRMTKSVAPRDTVNMRQTTNASVRLTKTKNSERRPQGKSKPKKNK